jgi:hypothetical protein
VLRIARLVLLGLVVAASVSAVAMAVDKQVGAKQTTKEDAPEATVTVAGVLHTTEDGFAVGSRTVSFGPPWYAASSALIKDRLGKSVTVTGSTDDNDGELSVRTIDGLTYRAKGRPPWAGGPKHHGTSASACKAKASAAKTKADDKKEKAGDDQGGPPPWAKAYGRRCKP